MKLAAALLAQQQTAAVVFIFLLAILGGHLPQVPYLLSIAELFYGKILFTFRSR